MIVFDPVRSEAGMEVSRGSRALLIGDGLEAGVRAALPDAELTCAPTLLDGVWQSGASRYELILVGYDGYEKTAAAVRGLRETAPESRILVLCEPHEEPTAVRVVDAGADDYVVGSLTQADLEPPRAARRLTPGTSETPPPPTAQADLTNQVLAQIGRGPEALLGALASLMGCVFQTPAVTIEIDDFRFVGAAEDDVVIDHPIPGVDTARGRIRLGRASGGAYPAESIARLESYAVLVATAFDQDRSARGWIDLALTDENTGLLNRRGFEAELAARLDVAARERRRLTLVRLDIDDFKTYNERHGRAAGDRLLSELAVLLRHCTRKSDLVARLADDEFTLLLVDDGRRRRADSEHPRSVATLAERFERAVADHAFEQLGGDAPGPVRLSTGLASYPWQAASRDELLSRAAPPAKDRPECEFIWLAGPRN